jgi:F0F1-type ATP synthase membrane subunit b/b'
MKFLFKLLVFILVAAGIIFVVRNYASSKQIMGVVDQKKAEITQQLKDKTKAASDQIIQEQADKLKASVNIN